MGCPFTRTELRKALADLQSIRQAIGALGPRLRRTKPGSKRHRAYWDSLTQLELTQLELQADECASKLQLALAELIPTEKKA